MKEVERLKEQQKRNTWRYQKPQQVGAMATDNKMLYGVGTGVLNRLNLSGPGAGLTNSRPGGASELQTSQNFGAGGEGGMGGMGTYRSSYGGGLDKSMEGLKLGFQSKFGA